MRPYVICHMTISIDGKVTGDFLRREECVPATEEYYRLNREIPWVENIKNCGRGSGIWRRTYCRSTL